MARVVIGAGFGDEGKGLMTDYFARDLGTVCRFNGGAQAGHTVQTPAGIRHVFHHVGSGAFQGADTHLSRHFISNPFTLASERAALANLGLRPWITGDPRGRMTTPYEMMINQMLELSRDQGSGRHGSCGLGILETVLAHDAGFGLRIGDLADPLRLASKVDRLRREWLPQRCTALGLTLAAEWQKRIDSDALRDHYLDLLKGMRALGRRPDAKLQRRQDDIVFEGAQGLLLDAESQFFPHVTPSRTGLDNVLEIARDALIDRLDVTYVTRCYATRHGAGPFSEEAGLGFDDATNVANDWQGSLRFGHLDIDLLADAIAKDRTRDFSGLEVTFGLAVTCLDQVNPDRVRFTVGQTPVVAPLGRLLSALERKVGIPVTHTAYGPSRVTVNAVWRH